MKGTGVWAAGFGHRWATCFGRHKRAIGHLGNTCDGLGAWAAGKALAWTRAKTWAQVGYLFWAAQAGIWATLVMGIGHWAQAGDLFVWAAQLGQS